MTQYRQKRDSGYFKSKTDFVYVCMCNFYNAIILYIFMGYFDSQVKKKPCFFTHITLTVVWYSVL